MKLAIMQNADTPQLESSAEQLRSAGYELRHCGPDLRRELQRIGCDTVLAPESMYSLGYDRLDGSVPAATLEDVERCDLFCEIKVRNVDKIRNRWPRLQDRICWWRVNGAQPEICDKGGDEVNLTCPVITACMWYGTETYRYGLERHDDGTPCYVKKVDSQLKAVHEHPQNEPRRDHGKVTLGDNGLAYVMWPPYTRRRDYDVVDRKHLTRYFPPYSLCHWGRNWGFGPIVDDCVKLGVRFFGNASPAGQIQHSQVCMIAGSSLCLLHLKSVDCPGWALYEAMLAGCPVVTPRLMRTRMLADDLLVHGQTCLEYGVPASLEYGRGPMEYELCMDDIRQALEDLADPETNRRIGEAGRNRLNELIWRPDRDGDGFRAFCERHWG